MSPQDSHATKTIQACDYHPSALIKIEKPLKERNHFFQTYMQLKLNNLKTLMTKLKYSKQIISKTSLGFTTKIKYGGWNLF